MVGLGKPAKGTQSTTEGDKRRRVDRTVPVLTEARLAISFTVTACDPGSRARAGKIATERGEFLTPAFLPVGTAGTVKGVWPSQLKEMG